MPQKIQAKIVQLINQLGIPFCGTLIQDFGNKKSCNNKYWVSPFTNISISGIGPVFYINKDNSKIYTILQRRYKDSHQWWFPGGYVDLIPFGVNKLIKDDGKIIKLPSFQQIKDVTVNLYYKNIIKYSCWQKAKKEINDPEFLSKTFRKHNIKWPEEIDSNWQSAWQREVLEETGININNYKRSIILNFKCNSTFMIGSEKDRLINIDGKFCSMLGVLEKQPKYLPDSETEELQWAAITDIIYDPAKKQYLFDGKQVNLYTISLIEECLFEILCHKIKKISSVTNPFTKQKISRFNSPQNLQSYIIEKSKSFNITKLSYLKSFLLWEFGDLGIGKNLTGKNSENLYNTTIAICRFLSQYKLDNAKEFAKLNSFIKNKINDLNYYELL